MWNISRSYYRGANGFIFVYDVTNRASFESVKRWRDNIGLEMLRQSSLVLVGNKADLEGKREVSEEEGKEMGEKLGMRFFEVSAKVGVNVHKAFSELVVDIMSNKQTLRVNSGAIKSFVI